MRVALLGASGTTGTLIAGLLEDRGITVTALPGRAFESHDRLAELVDEDTLVVNAAGLVTDELLSVLDAVVARGGSYVDVATTPGFLAAAMARSEQAVARGSRVVVGAGMMFLLGDALVRVAAGELGAPPEAAHVAYYLPRPLRTLRSFAPGARQSVGAALEEPAYARVGGELVPERIGEARRLAWFPRPVGPYHAAGIGGLEPLALRSSYPSLQTVRTYLAMPSWQAEGLQFVGSLMGTGAGRGLARRLLGTGDHRPDADQRRRVRWACVAEVADGDGAVVRAWSNGHDVYGVAAASAVEIVTRLIDDSRRPPPGVRSPGTVDEPAELLDDLAEHTGLRWSVVTR